MLKEILKYRFFSYEIFADNLDVIFQISEANRPLCISTLNPHSFYVAEQDRVFKQALEQSHILLADGIGIVFSNWLINGTKLRKTSGMDIFLFILKKIAAKECMSMKRIFFLGASDKTLSIIKSKINREFPSLCVGVYSPPFKPVFSNEEVDLMINKINDFNPYVLFVGMTAPKQEKWSYTNRNHLNTQIICSIGAVFDFYSGNIKRPGRAWQMFGLEWFGRFIREPRRLYKRYLISLPYFIAQVFNEAFRKRFSK